MSSLDLKWLKLSDRLRQLRWPGLKEVDTESFARHCEPLNLSGLSCRENVRRVLIAETTNRTPHLETSLEIAVRLAISGYSVVYLHFGKLLEADDFYHKINKGFFSWFTRGCVTYEDNALSLLCQLKNDYNLPIEVVNIDSAFFRGYLLKSLASEDWELKLPNSLEALKQLQWRNSNNLGISVASSLVSKLGTADFEYCDYLQLIRQLIADYQASYFLVESFLQKADNIESIVVFNGRFPASKAICQLAKESQIPVYYHERGCNPSKFVLTSYQLHDRISVQKDIRSMWENSSSQALAECSQLAGKYFEDLRNGLTLNWISFAKKNSGLSPDTLIERARSASGVSRVACFFASSDDEYQSVEDVFMRSPSEWSNQREALQAVINACQEASISLIVRVHPRLAQINSPDATRWDELVFINKPNKNIFVVPSYSSMSSYDLIDQVDVAITGHSTVGIESVYWGKPAILLSDSFYDEIGASLYRCRSQAEIVDCLSDIDALEVRPRSALPYAFYRATFGVSFNLFSPNGLFAGEFLGVNLSSTCLTPWGRVAFYFAKALKRLLVR